MNSTVDVKLLILSCEEQLREQDAADFLANETIQENPLVKTDLRLDTPYAVVHPDGIWGSNPPFEIFSRL